MSLALVLALSGSCAWAAEAASEEPAIEVDLGPQATPTPPPPTATAVPTLAPTAVPVATAAEAVAAVPASPAAKAAQDLNDVRFDKGQTQDSENGLMIIAPGAATAEDSLESFGIDSPFNWKNNGKAVLDPGKAVAGEEALELSAPDSSDLKERVRVETGEGAALPSDADYDLVERAGLVVGASEYRVDGRLARTKDGQYFAKRGTQVALRMEPGRQVYPGSIYTVFRESGVLRGTREQQREIGMLLRNVGVLKVVRIEGEEVLARVEKQYETIREGDLVRLRDPDRLRYYNSVRQGATALGLDLQGEVVGVDPLKMVAKPGDIVYLDLGRSQGLAPGVKLSLYRPAEELGVDDVRAVKVTGRLGQVLVVNVSHDSSVARIIRSSGEVRIGDRVRYR
jgi:hypothetical protein